AWLGPSPALVIDAASFAVSALLVSTFVPAAVRVTRAAAEHAAASYFAELRAGLHYIWRDPVLRALLLVLACTSPLDSSNTSVIMPVYAKRVFDSALALGLMFSTFAAGALIGTVLYGARGERLPRRTSYIVAEMLSGALIGMLIFKPPLWLIAIIYPVIGLAC